MSDKDFTSFIQEMRTAIRDIREDVHRIEQSIAPVKPHRWYNHLPFLKK